MGNHIVVYHRDDSTSRVAISILVFLPDTVVKYRKKAPLDKFILACNFICRSSLQGSQGGSKLVIVTCKVVVSHSRTERNMNQDMHTCFLFFLHSSFLHSPRPKSGNGTAHSGLGFSYTNYESRWVLPDMQRNRI